MYLTSLLTMQFMQSIQILIILLIIRIYIIDLKLLLESIIEIIEYLRSRATHWQIDKILLLDIELNQNKEYYRT